VVLLDDVSCIFYRLPMIQTRVLPLKYFSERRPGTVIDTIVVHSLYNPHVPPKERFSYERCVQILNDHQASAHYLIAQDGITYSCIPEEKRAKHAGESRLPFAKDCREDVGNFSIGIELIGDWTDPSYIYPELQYHTLAYLIDDITSRHPIRYVVGHDAIAPGRKRDPGDHFNWELVQILTKGKYQFPEKLCL
jgi:N-acetyl-anhydromuramyl-L-alanine amidase AmpD